MTLPLSSVVCHPPSFLRVLPTIVCSSPVSLSSSSTLLSALATLAIFHTQLFSHTCSLGCCRSVIAKVSVQYRHADVTSHKCSWPCPSVFLRSAGPPSPPQLLSTCSLRPVLSDVGLGLHLSPSSRLRTMPFLDTQNYPPESVSSPPARCAALPGESSVEMMLLSIRMTALKKDVVTTLIAHHGTIRLCTVWCKHALICCGMSRMHDMIIYNILLNSSRGFLLISYFKRFLCWHCPRLR